MKRNVRALKVNSLEISLPPNEQLVAGNLRNRGLISAFVESEVFCFWDLCKFLNFVKNRVLGDLEDIWKK